VENKQELFKLIFRYGLALAIVIGFFWLLGNISAMKAEGGMRDTLIMITGALVSKFSTIVDYEWGSSKSSQEKDKMLKNRGSGQ
jgi:hypothetical protein